MPGEITVKLKGDIDHHSAKELKQYLDDVIKKKKPDQLVLDFKQVSVMDSSGIGLILGRYKIMQKNGGALLVKNTSRQIDQVFRISGMNQVIKKKQ